MSELQEIEAYLFSLRNGGSKFGIDRMLKFVEALGHPENSFPKIHVAGTNGKGSVCAMLESVLRTAGLKTGMFTSPHLVYFGERVQVDRSPISPEAIGGLLKQLRPVAVELSINDSELHPTFFEFITAIAFLYFKQNRVDVGIIETGLGGRLDASNVIAPVLSIITSIGLDHKEQLGSTYVQVAKEKGGIIKEGVPVVIGDLPKDAEAVIRDIAEEQNAVVYSVNDPIFSNYKKDIPALSLKGEYQKNNAVTVLVALHVLNHQFPISNETIATGLGNVKWEGRWQVLKFNNRTVILDSTHNEEGVVHLRKNLSKLVQDESRKPIIAVGTLGDDRARSIMPVVSEFSDSLHLLVPQQPRACSFEVLSGEIPQAYSGDISESTVEGIVDQINSFETNSSQTIVVTGSIYLIGEVLGKLKEKDLSKVFKKSNLQDIF